MMIHVYTHYDLGTGILSMLGLKAKYRPLLDGAMPRNFLIMKLVLRY